MPTTARLDAAVTDVPRGRPIAQRGKAVRRRWCLQCHWRRNDFPAVYGAAHIRRRTVAGRSAFAVSLRRRRAKTVVSSRSPPPAARFINDRRWLSWRDAPAAAALFSATQRGLLGDASSARSCLPSRSLFRGCDESPPKRHISKVTITRSTRASKAIFIVFLRL